MRELYIDFDGVILDTITKLYDDFKKLYKNDLTEQKMREFCIDYSWEEIINDKNIINDSINSIKRIITSNKFNVSVLTHINSLKEGVLKINYLRNYFDDITIILCPKEISKTKMVHTKNAILIDDYSGNLREWKNEGGIPIKFSLNDEPEEFLVINNLCSVIDMF